MPSSRLFPAKYGVAYVGDDLVHAACAPESIAVLDRLAPAAPARAGAVPGLLPGARGGVFLVPEATLPGYTPTLHYGQHVWDDETGEVYWMAGHVAPRRAIAAVSAYIRETCGREDRDDQLGYVKLAEVTVRARYFRVEPNYRGWGEEAYVPTTADDLWGKPFTEVTVW